MGERSPQEDARGVAHGAGGAVGEPHGEREVHGGEQVVAVARDHGVDTIFTLSGAHVFPVYDGAVHAADPSS